MTNQTNASPPSCAARSQVHRRFAAATAKVVLSLLAAGLVASSASAATPAPGWSLHSQALPTNFSAAQTTTCPGTNSPAQHCDAYEVNATEAGSEASDGSTVTITDNLPAGVTVQSVTFFWSGFPASFGGPNTDLNSDLGVCTTAPVQCQLPDWVQNAVSRVVQPDDKLEMFVYVSVDDPNASGALTNSATVSGGGAPDVQVSADNTINGSDPGFGISGFTAATVGLDGQPDTQAAEHPYELTQQIDLNSEFRQGPSGQDIGADAVEDPKDIVVDLPLGFLGSAEATPTCSFAQLSSVASCPADTVVGQLTTEPENLAAIDGPIYNMVPEHGVAAEFGYLDLLNGSHPLYARVVPGPNGYVLQVTSPDIPAIPLASIAVTFYGNPAAKDNAGITPAAQFTNPSSCDGQPLVTSIHMDSWPHPGRTNPDGTPDLSDPNWVSASSTSPPVTGCDQLQFDASLSLQPDTTVADSPSGLHVDISVPESEDPNTLATPPLKDASVTLPAGFTVDPSSAAGLGACTPAEIALDSASSPTCPDDSKIGTVALQTPLIAGTLAGSIYLASEFDNPFHSLLAGYIVVDDPATGVVVKIPGNLTPNPVTGQITGVFDNNPQFPFSDLKLDFKGGPTGVLATPESCGTFTTSSAFSPWSFPDSGPASMPSDSFSIDSGCVNGFSPSFTAGMQNAQAGAYSPFVLSLSRSDLDQNFQRLSVTLPPGMLAKLAGVQECSEQQLAAISSQPGTGANALANPSCPAGSQVGTVETGSGVGPDPFFLGGKAYLTGPYRGAPYGLAVVVPAVAGPLDLGTVVVREALYVDPTTAQVTDVSDPFPTILQGIPLRIRRIDVTLNRPDFTLNPTSCNPMAVTGTLTSTGGLNYAGSSRFQVGGCSSLGFSPKLKLALTGKGKTRSGDHPTLTAMLTDPSGQANIRTARVALPLSLALDPNNSQQVCNYYVAQAVHGGAVGCPASTIVGQATADTPLLSQPLSGPVYLVQGIRFSHGQAIHTLPSLLIPLRGQISLDLRAQSSVSGGKLVTTFASIPDAPVSKFVLQITGGPKGLLVITGRGRTICGKAQVSNASFGAQSGKSEGLNPSLATPACNADEKHDGRITGRQRHVRRASA